MGTDGDFCAFTKAVEHLGDRWSLVIIRELYVEGPRRFTSLVDGLPGISRSVLASRLRELRLLALVEHDEEVGHARGRYRLTQAGRELGPVLRGLWQWSRRWIPSDPSWAERDPDIILAWLTHRIEGAAIPDRRTVVAFDITGTIATRFWLVLERGQEPSTCLEDPRLAADRYVYVESDAATLLPIARGLMGWGESLAAGTTRLYGEPALVRDLPRWFGDVDPTPQRLVFVAGHGRAADRRAGRRGTQGSQVLSVDTYR